MASSRKKRRQQEMDGFPVRRFSDKMWGFIQLAALGGILAASMKTLQDSPRPKMLTRGVAETTRPLVMESFRKSPRKMQQNSITSRVVALPSPAREARRPASRAHYQMDLEIETRQLRFERAGLENWELAQIRRRKAEGEWESVPLVQNHENQALGSVFIELDEGDNEFEVVFRNARGRTTSYPVRIRHVRSHTS